MKYKFSLEKRRKNGILISENVPIRLTVSHSQKRITLTTGFRVDFKSWDSDKQMVKKGFRNKQGIPYNLINAKLFEQKSFLDKYFMKVEIEGKDFNLEDLKQQFAKHFLKKKSNTETEKNNKDFYALFDEFVKERGSLNNWTPATYIKFKTVKRHLLSFNKNLTFEMISEKLISDYVIFLRDVKNFKNSTIKKHISFFKWFLNWAVDKNYLNNTAYKSFKPKFKMPEKQVIYLTPKELDKLRNFEIPEQKKYLERVRDVFLFSCYTSLRYSDLKQLKHTDIKDDKIEIITQKTVDKLRVKLNSKAMDIVNKYKNITFENKKLLPVISNQRMNEYLKELCRLAEINEPVTLVYFKGNNRYEEIHPKYELIGTHTGRRTFICNALLKGMPVHAVMKITGHSDYKAMQPYVDIVSKEVDNMIDKYIDF